MEQSNNIEIAKYQPVKDSACVCTFSIRIKKWHNFTIHSLSLFSKDGKSWITFPSRAYESDGKKKFFQFCGFEDHQVNDAFKAKIKEAITEHINKVASSVRINEFEKVDGNEPLPF